MPQGSDKKSCFSIQKFACAHEYFPVYTSVHFPDNEMGTIMYAYSNKEILFEKCPVQFPMCLSNIQY